MTEFAHLSLHTQYSIVDSTIRLNELARKTRERGMNTVAITDDCNLFALWKAQKLLRDEGVKPIFGVDMRVADAPEMNDRLMLLAKDETGLANIRNLMSFAYSNDVAYRCITTECLFANHEGLIVLSSGTEGLIGRLLLTEETDQAVRLAEMYKQTFGDRFYIELTRLGKPREDAYQAKVIPFADELQLPVVATNDVRFIDREDFDAHETRYCIAHRQRKGDGTHSTEYTEHQYLRSADEMRELFEDIPDAIDNAAEIATRCTVKVDAGHHLPLYKTQSDQSPAEILRTTSNEQMTELLERFDSIGKQHAGSDVYQARLDKELKIIVEMEYAGYFLIVADFVRWAKKQNIPVGPGRGSGSASLVAFVLGITEIDPIEHDLMFERLLNPERVSLPDFDIDFCMHRRGEVIRYVTDVYGENSVGQIVTFGTLAAKAVVRDVTRVHGKGFATGESIVQLIPDRLGVTLPDALDEVDELGQKMQSDEDIREVMNRSLRLEGLVRNMGKHPGGIVITPEQLDAIVPVYREHASGELISQLDKQDIEEIGVVKFDFLGLKTVTALAHACEAVNLERAKSNEPPLLLSELPLDDAPVYQMLQEALTSGVFQLESRGMRAVLRDLGPDRLEDLVALLALFRPGPLNSGVVDQYVKRKHGQEQVRYLHPTLESVLKKTYGVMVYQEDVMTVGRELAGFSMGEADRLRQAMGKKSESVMKEMEEKFVAGCIDNGVEERIAASIFEDMEKFAQYAFNRAHAVGYAVVAYQTAYLKTHYPAQYLASLATCDMGDRETVCELMAEAKRMGVTLLGPSVNESRYGFSAQKDTIRVGLGSIKGLGRSHAESVENARKEGPFISMIDMCSRAGFGRNHRKQAEALIRSGALDCVAGESSINDGRPKLLAQVDTVLAAAEGKAIQEANPFDDLIGVPDEASDEVKEHDYKPTNLVQTLSDEKDVLGFFVSGHPMSVYRQELRRKCTHGELATLKTTSGTQTVAGIVRTVRTRSLRNGATLQELVLEDEHGSVELTAFVERNQLDEDQHHEGDLVVVECNVRKDEESQERRIRTKSIDSIAEYRMRNAAKVQIDVTHSDGADRVVACLQEEFKEHEPRGCLVVVQYSNNGYTGSLELDEEWQLNATNEAIERLQWEFGVESVSISY